MQGNGLFFASIAAISTLLFGLWFHQLHYPRFREYADPTHQYSARFPAQPIWSRGSAGGGSDADATRSPMWSGEAYRIRVIKDQSQRFFRVKDLNARSLVQNVLGYDNVAVLRARPDVLYVTSAAEYERWVTGMHIVVGRAFIANEALYEMTVSGRDIRLDDERVQQFFNSFQFAQP